MWERVKLQKTKTRSSIYGLQVNLEHKINHKQDVLCVTKVMQVLSKDIERSVKDDYMRIQCNEMYYEIISGEKNI